jgi:hypothetical protein
MLFELMEVLKNCEKIPPRDLRTPPTVLATHSEISSEITQLKFDYRFFSTMPAFKAIVQI